MKGEESGPSRATFEAALIEQHDVLQEMVDEYIEKTYLDPLKQEPEDNARRAALGQVRVALRQYDAVIEGAYEYLNEGGVNKALAYNHLGIAHELKGELRQAEFFYRQAVELVPKDEGVKRNLAEVLAKLGKGERRKEPEAGAEEASKGEEAEVDEDRFYWME